MNSLTDQEKLVLRLVYKSLLANPRILRNVALLTENLIYQRGDIGKSKYYALNELDRKIERYIDFDNGYFVELGANDGVSQSNTLYFEKSRAWTGILIEPTPHNYLLCKKNRSASTKNYCNTCVSSEYKEKFVEILYSNLMSVSLGLQSDVADPIAHAKSGQRFLAPTEDVFSFGALARTLGDILKESSAPSIIDLLSLDVEGSEIEVLNGINHSKWRFKYILVECRNVTKLSAYLEQHQYQLVDQFSSHDYLFWNGT